MILWHSQLRGLLWRIFVFSILPNGLAPCLPAYLAPSPPASSRQIQCDNPKYCRGGTLKVTITDRCPTCDGGRMHFDLSMPGFSRIADTVAGRIYIKYRR